VEILEKIKYHRTLACYFSSKSAWLDNEIRIPNTRRLIEMAFQQRNAQLWTSAEATLFDAQFVYSKCAAGKVFDLVADYQALFEVAPESSNLCFESLHSICEALELSMHIVSSDYLQLASQMIGRLLDNKKKYEIEQFIKDISTTAPRPWLRPLQPCFTPPGGPLARTLIGHTNAVSSVIVTPDGKYILSNSWDNTLKVWDFKTGIELSSFLSGKNVHSFVLSKDGHYISLTTTGNWRTLWDMQTGMLVSDHHNNDFRAISEGHGISFNKNELTVWDIFTGEKMHSFTGHEGVVQHLEVTRDGKCAVSYSADQTIKIWNLLTGAELYTLTKVKICALTKDGQHALIVPSGAPSNLLKVWDITKGMELCTIIGDKYRSYYESFVVSSENQRIVTVNNDSNMKLYTINIWDIKTGEQILSLYGHTDSILTLAISPDGKYVVSGSQDKTIKVWNLEAEVIQRTHNEHQGLVNAVALTKDEKHIISNSGWATPHSSRKLWNLLTGEYLRDFNEEIYDTSILLGYLQSRGISDPLQSVVLVPNSKLAVSWIVHGSPFREIPYPNSIGVYNSETWESLYILQRHKDEIDAVTVSPDGRLAISGSRDNTLKIWNLKKTSVWQIWCLIKKIFKGTSELRTLHGHKDRVVSVAVTPDSQYVVSGSWDQTIKVWNLRTGKELRTISGHKDHVNTVAFTPDGRYIVSGSQDKTLKLWDIKTGTMLGTFNCEGEPTCCICAPLDRIIAGDTLGLVYILKLED
jgi:WD40 repeat protein